MIRKKHLFTIQHTRRKSFSNYFVGARLSWSQIDRTPHPQQKYKQQTHNPKLAKLNSPYEREERTEIIIATF